MRIEIDNKIIERFLKCSETVNDAEISALLPEERYKVARELKEARNELEAVLYNAIRKEPTVNNESTYQVWVTLEEWRDDNKIDDVETCMIGEVKTEAEGRQLFMAVQDVSLAVKSHLEPMLKTLEP